MKRKYDAIVIGSGFGGSITSHLLSKRGMKVCLVERGRQWTTYNFPRSLSDFLMNLRLFKLDKVPLTERDFPFLEKGKLRNVFITKEDGLYDFKLSSTGMHAAVANGVGGGSLIYACVLMIPPGDVFDECWPTGVEWADVLDYEGVRDELGAVQALMPGGRELHKTRFLREAWERAGKQGELELPYLAHQRLAKPNSKADVPSTIPQECVSCANCVLGCRRMAKNTLDHVYIKEAVEEYGLHLYPSHEVTTLEPYTTDEGEELYRVICEKQHRAFEAKIVVLAAGTLGTTKLLLQCRKKGHLPHLSKHLGEHFSGNGDFQAAALQVEAPLAPPHPYIGGPTITSSIKFDNFVLEDGGVPKAVRGLMALVSSQMGELGYLKKLMKNFNFSELAPLLDQADSLSGKPNDTLARTFMFLCAGRDGADGKIVLDKDGSDIDIEWNWENEKSQKLYRDIENTLRHLVEVGMGGGYFASPLWDLFGNLITVHPLGGCSMGDTFEKGVVDSSGEVFNYPRLFVADGSIIPAALGVNPSLTIAALAKRIATKIVERYPHDNI